MDKFGNDQPLFSYKQFCDGNEDAGINPTDLLRSHARGCEAQSGRACSCGLQAARDRLDKILSRQEAIEDSLDWLADWSSKAYPLDLFPEPSAEDLKRADDLLRAGGLSIDLLSASNIRFTLERVIETFEKALERKKE